jgi:hypothetical protein
MPPQNFYQQPPPPQPNQHAQTRQIDLENVYQGEVPEVVENVEVPEEPLRPGVEQIEANLEVEPDNIEAPVDAIPPMPLPAVSPLPPPPPVTSRVAVGQVKFF